jgi:ubiquitin conjugation factor E4 B
MVIRLLSRVTKNVKDPFITEELGEPFANALNFSLDSLIGKKGLKLKVNNPEAYNFEPRTLLSHIISMYANMSSEVVFKKNVIND